MKTIKTIPALALAATLVASAAELTLQVTPYQGADPVSLSSNGEPLSFSRVDLLLSQFSLQARDGSWMDARDDLYGFVSLGQNRLRVDLGDVPSGEYQAIRFTVGLPAEANGADPNSFPVDHPLHPQLNNLHWGWQGGYIFMALEGYDTPGHGFLYHLGNQENATEVTVPVTFDTKSARTLNLSFDLATLFGPSGLNPAKTSSTHSRPADPLVSLLKEKLSTAFSLQSLSAGTFQSLRPATKTIVPHGTPFALQISTLLPQVELPSDNPLTLEGIALGKRLFSDPLLSHQETQSCASCHQQEAAFSDAGKAFSIGATGALGRRSSMPLFNLAWHKQLFWDGRVTSLREQVLHPITDPQEMAEPIDRVLEKLNAHPDYPALFSQAFGNETITSNHLGLALEQFLLTLLSQDSKFDRAMRKEVVFNDQEKRGFELFVTEYDPKNNLRGADCFHCHGGPLFTSHEFSNNGLDAQPQDLGRYEVTGEDGDRGKFKVPSLRNIALTAPYMHDGRFKTLEEVISHYNTGVQRSATLDPNLAKHPGTQLELTIEDQEALLAFLKTLSDSSLTTP